MRAAVSAGAGARPQAGAAGHEGPAYAALVARPLDAAALVARVAHDGAGATALFLGTVREVNVGRAVLGIDYHAYAAMAERELADIAREAAARWAPARIAVEHRTGRLGLGEASVAIAASHLHRAPAFDACRWVLEAVKARVPIWKREHYADGTRDWVDARAGAPAGAAVDGPSDGPDGSAFDARAAAPDGVRTP